MAKATATKRVYFNKVDDAVKLPNLIEHQKESFDWFTKDGLAEIFAEINPIEDYTGQKLELRFKKHHFEEPKISEAGSP